MHPLSPEQQQAYLAHLDLPRPSAADRANLDRLIAAHLNRVAFENLDVLLERPIEIDAEATFAKIVERGRGGYCFEANSLFARLLLSLGYPRGRALQHSGWQRHPCRDRLWRWRPSGDHWRGCADRPYGAGPWLHPA
jgi:arylamine N-acetyltransferase